ncbi:MAG: RecQ family ATP-dependent DNA helicase [Limosilactobacillus sp.]
MANSAEMYRLLHERVGYQDFRDGQQETIEALLAGHDTLAVLPTGAGKSLLYQLPAYLLPGGVLIVSPLLSLMQDQVDRLRQHGEKRVVMLSSQLRGAARDQVLQSLASFRFIFASPEILTNPAILTAMRRIPLSMMVVDEAHCISQWGPDFRPEYLLLQEIRRSIGQPRLLMLTATATPRVRRDILNKLGLDREHVHTVIRSVNRPNIFLAVERVASQQAKDERLLQLVASLPSPGIIYFASRKLATQVAEWLHEQTGLAVAPYHAGMSPVDRFKIQQQFMNNQVQLICATSAFGMGVDKNDIRYVIHYHLPANLESYMQEIGRAGRDGQQSVAVLLYAPGDEGLPSQLTAIDLPSVALLTQVKNHQLRPTVLGEKQDLFTFYLDHDYQPAQIIAAFKGRRRQQNISLQKMLDYIGLATCRRRFLLDYFGEEAGAFPPPCCDVDQRQWQGELVFPAPPAGPVNGQQADWHQRLRRLFNQPRQ